MGIPHAVLKSDAYRHLSLMARSLLVEIALRFNGYNNGSIAISYREFAARLNRKNQAPFAAAVAQLIKHGLVEIALDHPWKDGKSREYCLSFISTTDKAGRPIAATNGYLAWRPTRKISATNVVAKGPKSATASVALAENHATSVVVQFPGSREIHRR